MDKLKFLSAHKMFFFGTLLTIISFLVFSSQYRLASHLHETPAPAPTANSNQNTNNAAPASVLGEAVTQAVQPDPTAVAATAQFIQVKGSLGNLGAIAQHNGSFTLLPNTVGSDNIINQSIKQQDLATNSVNSRIIQNHTIRSSDLSGSLEINNLQIGDKLSANKLDLGANTITDGNLNGDWQINSGHLQVGSLSGTGNRCVYVDENGTLQAKSGDCLLSSYSNGGPETDPIFSASAAAGVTNSLITNWNSVYANRLTNVTNAATGLSLALNANNLTATLASGYVIPTTTEESNWNTAYANRLTSAAAPLNISNNVLGILPANTSTDGYLSSADWNTFNGKQAALISGTNLKTINGASLLGSGDITTTGSMLYPGSGVPNSTGTAWGTSYTVGTAANNLVQLNGSGQLPALDGSLLTNLPSGSGLTSLPTASGQTLVATGSGTYDWETGKLLPATTAANDFLLGNGTSWATATLANVRTALGIGSLVGLTPGTGANNLVQLNGSGQLPALDGSLLTNLPSGSMTYPGVGIPNSTGSAWGTSLALSTDLSITATNDSSLASAKAIQTALSAKANSTGISFVAGSWSDLQITNADSSISNILLDSMNYGDTNDALHIWSIHQIGSMLALKQDALVSGTNLKTINGNSILGSGNLVLAVGATTPPTYRNDTCTQGQYAYSADHLTRYDCVATNYWMTSTLTNSLSDAPSAPTITSVTVSSNGTTVTAVFSAAVQNGAGGSGGWTLNTPTSALTYVSGSGTNTLTYSSAVTIYSTSTPTVSYTQPGNGVEAVTGGADLVSISNATVVNSSTQSAPVAPTLTSVTIDTTGSNWTFVYSGAVTASTTAALCNAYSVTMSTAGAETLTYSSGTGTNTVVCTGSVTVNSGETVTSGLNYTPGTITDIATNALASISGKAVVNNSTQGTVAWSCSDANIFCENFNGSTACGNAAGDTNCNRTYSVNETSGPVSFSNSASGWGTKNGPYTSLLADASTTSENMSYNSALTSVNTAYTQLYFKIGTDLTLNNSTGIIFGEYYNGTSNLVWVLGYKRISAGNYQLTLQYYNAANGTATSYSTLQNYQLNTVYGVRVYWNKGQATGGISWGIDNSLSGSFTDQGLTNTDGTTSLRNITNMMVANITSSVSNLQHLFVGMMKINSTAYPAPTIP